ncbi:MAG: hypothetical protein QME93_00765 [Bacillota bacterium]|nr:hypothetical protein [Bacillota bacterium]MDI7248585.1 hypothetical protein [Bacillota bacterium]
MTSGGQCLADADFIIDRVLEVHSRTDFRLGSKSQAQRSARKRGTVGESQTSSQSSMTKIGDAWRHEH